jgi:hypothetical protein
MMGIVVCGMCISSCCKDNKKDIELGAVQPVVDNQINAAN